jgi:hypothetical protein
VNGRLVQYVFAIAPAKVFNLLSKCREYRTLLSALQFCGYSTLYEPWAGRPVYASVLVPGEAVPEMLQQVLCFSSGGRHWRLIGYSSRFVPLISIATLRM